MLSRLTGNEYHDSVLQILHSQGRNARLAQMGLIKGYKIRATDRARTRLSTLIKENPGIWSDAIGNAGATWTRLMGD